MDQDLFKLVLARLEAMPDYIEVNLGNKGTLTKVELIKHVKLQDDFGKKIVEKQLAYLKSLKTL